MRKMIATFLFSAAASFLFAVTPWGPFHGSSGVCVAGTDSYTVGGASGNETIRVGCSQLTVSVWGAGGGGSRFVNANNPRGGGGGAYSAIVVNGPFSAGAIAYSVGTGGVGTGPVNQHGGSGGPSSAGGAGQLVNIANVGGGIYGNSNSPGAGGAAGTGGSTNLSGGNAGVVAFYDGGAAAGPGGGAGGHGATSTTDPPLPGNPPGGGGGASIQAWGNGQPGADGTVTFQWQ